MGDESPAADIKLKELASYTDTQTNYYEIRITGTKTLTIDNAGIVAITGNGNMAAGGSVLQADVL